MKLFTIGFTKKDAKTFYAYALASPTVYGKPTMEIREWAGSPE